MYSNCLTILLITSTVTQSFPFHLPQEQYSPFPQCSEMTCMNTDVLSRPVPCMTVVPCCCNVSKPYQGCLVCFKSPCGFPAAVSLNLSHRTPCKIDLGSQTQDSADSIHIFYCRRQSNICQSTYVDSSRKESLNVLKMRSHL